MGCIRCAPGVGWSWPTVRGAAEAKQSIRHANWNLAQRPPMLQFLAGLVPEYVVVRLSTRILLVLALTMIPLVAGTAWFGSTTTRRMLEAELQERLTRYAVVYATQLELQGEHRRVERLEEDALHTRQRLHQQVRAQREAMGLRRLRVLGLDQRILIDDEGVPDHFARDFELELDRHEIRQVVETGEPAFSVLFRSADGVWFQRAYAALRVEDRVVAVVMVEGSAESFARLERAETIFASLLLLAIFMALMASWVMGRRVTAPLRELQSAALRMGKGDLRSPIREEGPQEVLQLSRQLESMRKALVERETSMRTMLAGVAHEIRNPLGAMELQLGLLEDDLADLEHTPQTLGRVRTEVARLSTVVETFLAWARETPPRIEIHAMRDVVEDAVEVARASGPVEGPRMDVQVEDAHVRVDAGEMKAALLNVLLNALQASRSGEAVKVEAFLERDHAVIRVRDEGHGMDDEALARAVEPFFTTREKGSGLGLALAQRALVRHHGALTLHSSLGQGTTVVLRWPRGEVGNASSSGSERGEEKRTSEEIWIG